MVSDLLEGVRYYIDEGRVVPVTFEGHAVAFNRLFNSIIIKALLDAGFSFCSVRVVAVNPFSRPTSQRSYF